MTKVYVSASFPRAGEARDLGRKLAKLGYEVISDWYDQPNGYELDGAERVVHLAQCSKRDYNQLTSADHLVQLTGDDGSNGGRHAEFGIAMSNCDRLILIGPRESVFHYDPDVDQYDSVDSFMRAIPTQETEDAEGPEAEED